MFGFNLVNSLGAYAPNVLKHGGPQALGESPCLPALLALSSIEHLRTKKPTQNTDTDNGHTDPRTRNPKPRQTFHLPPPRQITPSLLTADRSRTIGTAVAVRAMQHCYQQVTK